MKKFLLPSGIVYVLLAAACGHANDAAKKSFDLPAPGTPFAAAQMPVKGSLNNAQFGVRVSADSLVKDGVYDVCAYYGFDTANGKFSMPKGLEHYKLELKTGSAPYTYVVGFRVPKDTAFYDYFEISADHNTIGMKYLKAYTFD